MMLRQVIILYGAWAWGLAYWDIAFNSISIVSHYSEHFSFSRDQNKFICCEMYCFRINILASSDNRQRPSGLLTVIVWTLME